MYSEIDFSQLGGLFFNQDTLSKIQESYKQTITQLIAIFGDKLIVSGCDVSNNTITSGWIVYGGELLPFKGGSLQSRVVLQTVIGNEQFDDGNLKPVYTTKSLVMAPTGGFAYADLKRIIPYQQIWCKGDLKDVICSAAYIASNFDSTGLGKNERSGWAICNGQNGTIDLGGRVTLGYSSVIVDPGDNVWDLVYNTMGYLGGQKTHVQTLEELANHDHIVNANSNGSSGGSGGIMVSDYKGWEKVNKKNGNYFSIEPAGSSKAMDWRQPFAVTLKIMKL